MPPPWWMRASKQPRASPRSSTWMSNGRPSCSTLRLSPAIISMASSQRGRFQADAAAVHESSRRAERSTGRPASHGCRQATCMDVGCLHPGAQMAKPTAYRSRIEVLQGTLDLIVLQTLQWGPRHGYGIARAIQAGSGELLRVDTGSLYPG